MSVTEKDAQLLVFEAGQKTQQLQLTIKDDDTAELDESFLLIFMDSDCCVQVKNNLTAKVIIVDNDRGTYNSYMLLLCIVVYNYYR